MDQNLIPKQLPELTAQKNIMIPCAKFAGKTFVQIEGLHKFIAHLQSDPDCNKNMKRGLEKVKNTLNSLHASAKEMKEIAHVHASSEELEKETD